MSFMRIVLMALSVFISTCGGSSAISSMKIGVEGGTFTGPDGATLVIPEGALDGEIEFAISEASGEPVGFHAAGQIYRFEPAGTTFKVPVSVTLAYDPDQLLYQESSVRLWWSNSIDGQWTVLTGTIDTSAKTVTGSTDHLSFGVSGEYHLDAD
jgi:hypothetical protein